MHHQETPNMRKFVIALIALSLVVASTAFAGNLVNEAFTYADGNLVPNTPGLPALGPWANYSGGTGDVLVASGYATGIMNTTARANDDQLPFTAQTLLVPTYYCADVYIPCFGSTAPLGGYFLGLKDAGTSNFFAKLHVLSQGTTGGWTFGISVTSTSTSVGVTPWTSTLNCDTWYRIVAKYDPVAKSATMWVNPTIESSPSVTDVNAASTSQAVSTVILRQGASSTFPTSPGYPGTTIWSYRVDNLGVGTTFEQACYNNIVPVNSSTWGQLKSLYR
jgi:hypothetical protein